MRGLLAVVTGGHRGIGAATCAAFAEAGYRAVSIDLDADPNDKLQHACDVSDVAALVRTLEEIERDHGPVDALVNNAGIIANKPLFELTPEIWDRTLAINLRAVMFASQHVARRMVDLGRKGSIVNVASSAGRYGSVSMDYGASKAGVIGLTLSMAKVLADRGVRVNAIAPGQVVTDLHRALPPETQKANAARIGMKRPADPAEIARVIVFLSGEGASFMTGSVVDVNGGRF